MFISFSRKTEHLTVGAIVSGIPIIRTSRLFISMNSTSVTGGTCNSECRAKAIYCHKKPTDSHIKLT